VLYRFRPLKAAIFLNQLQETWKANLGSIVRVTLQIRARRHSNDRSVLARQVDRAARSGIGILVVAHRRVGCGAGRVDGNRFAII
jgi:hypothetical protein